MATLTYDPTPADQPEFTPEEQDSIQVGEALEQQQNQLLAGKYQNAQELEKAYMELQSKLGTPREESEEQPEEESEPESPEEEEEQPEEESEEQPKEEAEEKPYPMTEESVEVIMNVAGGKKQYKEMTDWASKAFSQKEIALYDHVMESGDAAAALFAVQALKLSYKAATGYDGQVLQGKAAPVENNNVFRSQAEVIEAMSDPRYDKDPAYRNDVFEKLERSNVNF